jgi:hypothetical protein
VILSGILLILNIKYIKDIYTSFQEIKDKYKHHKQTKGQSYKNKVSRLKANNKKFKSGNVFLDVAINADESRDDKSSPASSFGKDDLTSMPDSDHEEDIPEWNKLTLSDKARLFSYWAILNIIGCVLVFVGSVLILANTKEVDQEGEVFLGLGVLLTYITILRYYETIPGYNIVLLTFQRSAKIVAMAVVGIVPLFIGFALLGMCLFWKTKRFSDIGYSLITLYTLMHGDAMFDVFIDLTLVDYIWSQVYLYLYVTATIIVILNIFIVIIEDGYVVSRTMNKNDWLKPLTYNTIQKGQSENQTGTTQANGSQPQTFGAVGNQVTDLTPFAKLNRKKKRQRMSRDTLARMLLHDKATIQKNRQNHGIRDSQATMLNKSSLSFQSPKKRKMSVQRGISDDLDPLVSAEEKMQDLSTFMLTSCKEEVGKTDKSGPDAAEVKAKYQKAIDDFKAMLDQLKDDISNS